MIAPKTRHAPAIAYGRTHGGKARGEPGVSSRTLKIKHFGTCRILVPASTAVLSGTVPAGALFLANKKYRAKGYGNQHFQLIVGVSSSFEETLAGMVRFRCQFCFRKLAKFVMPTLRGRGSGSRGSGKRIKPFSFTYFDTFTSMIESGHGTLPIFLAAWRNLTALSRAMTLMSEAGLTQST